MPAATDKERGVDVEMDSHDRKDPNLKPNNQWNDTVILMICFVGLQASYLTWGILQEKVMTQEYTPGKFTSSTFLVFANRLAAIVMGFVLMNWSKSRGDPQGNAPLHQYAFPAISNVLSSYGQYEALKHVSFPLQVLAKASKLIPVMLMGVVLQKKRYELGEYVQALIITSGVAMFSYSERAASAANSTESTAIGVFLLALYIVCDSFTSQYQDKVYKTYHCTQYQMMFGVNLFSILFTTLYLFGTGELFSSISFLLSDAVAMKDIVILSLSSSFGQLFIYYSIKKFGPVTFSLMMTVRQMLSMLISCVMYGHPLGLMGRVGAGIVFLVLFYRSIKNKK